MNGETIAMIKALQVKSIEELKTSGGSADAGKVIVVGSDGKLLPVDLEVGEGQIAVDGTLKIPGAAADAKKTGDAIASLNGSLENQLYELPMYRGYWFWHCYTSISGNSVAYTASNKYLTMLIPTTYHKGIKIKTDGTALITIRRNTSPYDIYVTNAVEGEIPKGNGVYIHLKWADGSDIEDSSILSHVHFLATYEGYEFWCNGGKIINADDFEYSRLSSNPLAMGDLSYEFNEGGAFGFLRRKAEHTDRKSYLKFVRLSRDTYVLGIYWNNFSTKSVWYNADTNEITEVPYRTFKKLPAGVYTVTYPSSDGRAWGDTLPSACAIDVKGKPYENMTLDNTTASGTVKRADSYVFYNGKQYVFGYADKTGALGDFYYVRDNVTGALATPQTALEESIGHANNACLFNGQAYVSYLTDPEVITVWNLIDNSSEDSEGNIVYDCSVSYDRTITVSGASEYYSGCSYFVVNDDTLVGFGYWTDSDGKLWYLVSHWVRNYSDPTVYRLMDIKPVARRNVYLQGWYYEDGSIILITGKSNYATDKIIKYNLADNTYTEYLVTNKLNTLEGEGIQKLDYGYIVQTAMGQNFYVKIP